MCRTYPRFAFPTRLTRYRDNVCALGHNRDDCTLGTIACQESLVSCCFLTAAFRSKSSRLSLLTKEGGIRPIYMLWQVEGTQP
jgi:hypothetical protein